jgi:hypothetical protein
MKGHTAPYRSPLLRVSDTSDEEAHISISALSLWAFFSSYTARGWSHTKEVDSMASCSTIIFHFLAQYTAVYPKLRSAPENAWLTSCIQNVYLERSVIFISFVTYGANLSKACLCRPVMVAARLKEHTVLERGNIWVAGFQSRARNYAHVSLYYSPKQDCPRGRMVPSEGHTIKIYAQPCRYKHLPYRAPAQI